MDIKVNRWKLATFILALVLLATVNGFKISHRMQLGLHSREKLNDEDTSYIEHDYNDENEQFNPLSVQGSSRVQMEQGVSVKSTTGTNQSNSKGLSPSHPNYDDVLAIFRAGSSSEQSELAQIKVTHETMQNTIRNEYKALRAIFVFSEVTLELNDNDQAFMLSITSTDGAAHTTKALEFLNLDSKFTKINNLFSISEVIQVEKLV